MVSHRICGSCAFREDCIEFLEKGGKIKYDTQKRTCIGALNGVEEFFVPHSKG